MAAQPIWIRAGYSTRNQYRNAKAREQINPDTGQPFTSYRQQRDYLAKSHGKPRDYSAERAARDRAAQSRGYPSANRERSIRNALKTWGVGWFEFNDMRRSNARHWREVRSGNVKKNFPVYLHNYSEPKNGSAANYVGYIVSYFHAIVDPEHNWDSVRDDSGQWIMTDKNGTLVPESDPWWFLHFVKYSDKRNENYYETRYGVMDA